MWADGFDWCIKVRFVVLYLCFLADTCRFVWLRLEVGVIYVVKDTFF